MQKRVNELLAGSSASKPPATKPPAVNIDALADAVIRGDYGNGEERKRRLGANYAAVQESQPKTRLLNPALKRPTCMPVSSEVRVGGAFLRLRPGFSAWGYISGSSRSPPSKGTFGEGSQSWTLWFVSASWSCAAEDTLTGRSVRPRASPNTAEINLPENTSDIARVEGVCEHCKTDLPGGEQARRFCSAKCRLDWWHQHPERLDRKALYSFTCAHCGQPFMAYGNRNRKYCSHACYVQARFGTKGGRR